MDNYPINKILIFKKNIKNLFLNKKHQIKLLLYLLH